MNGFTYRNNSSSFANYDWFDDGLGIKKVSIKNPIAINTVLQKVRKIGSRNNPPSCIEVFLCQGGEMGLLKSFAHSFTYPSCEAAKEAFVEFMFDYSLKGNIIGLNVVKRHNINGTSLKIIVGPTKDYSESNIDSDVIDSILSTIRW